MWRLVPGTTVACDTDAHWQLPVHPPAPAPGHPPQQPGELRVRGDVRLHKDGGLCRVDAAGDVERGRGVGGVEQLLGLVGQRDGVQVDHAEEGVCCQGAQGREVGERGQTIRGEGGTGGEGASAGGGHGTQGPR